MLVRSCIGALILLAVALAPPTSPTAQAQTIAAVVNDGVVTDRDIEQRLRLALLFAGQRPTAENAARLRPQVLRALVDEQLQLQEAGRLGIDVTDAEIDDQVRGLAEGNNLTTDQLAVILDRAGIDIETLRRQIRTQIAWSLVARQQLLPRVVVSDVQVAQSLKRANAGETEYRLFEIFLPTYTPSDEQRVLEDATQLRAAVQGGADFSALAEQFSTAPSAERGGDLGWLPASALPDDLRQVVAELRDGGVSRPVRTPEGVYLFLRRDQRQSTAGLSISLRRIDAPADEVGELSLDAFIAAARTEAPSCPALETFVRSIDGPPVRALEDVDPAALQEPIATLALTEPIGVLSEPVRTPEGTTFVMVCGRSGGASAEARERIVEQLRLESLERLASRYLRNLRQDAFIDLRSPPG